MVKLPFTKAMANGRDGAFRSFADTRTNGKVAPGTVIPG
jgi:hypothetical protein